VFKLVMKSFLDSSFVNAELLLQFAAPKNPIVTKETSIRYVIFGSA